MAGSAPSSSDHIDRLSNLPERILLHILSFLPTEEAVATSILSKPWQHLWTLVPAIDLCDDDAWSETLEESIVSKVLDGNKAPIIRRFRLSGESNKSSYIDEWVSSATERNVEELDLDFNDVRNISGSTFGFCCAPESCKTLVVMKVKVEIYGFYDSHFVIGGHLNDLYFPSLKILHLKGAEFKSPDPSLLGLFSSRFPLLEELVVVHWAACHHDLKISLSNLRRLEIESMKKYTLHIEAPRLQYLLLWSAKSNGGFRVEDLPNLVEAKVDVLYDNSRDYEYEETLINESNDEYEETLINQSNDEYDEYEETLIKKCDDAYGESLINFVNALSNGRVLNLSHSTMQSLSSHSLVHADRIQHFHNLVELDLELDYSLLGIAMIMLSKFVNLEHLKITGYRFSSNRYNKTTAEYSLVPPTHVPNCLTYHLKTFCFLDLRCLEYEMEFTIYVLKNSLVLENVKILFHRRVAWKEGYDSKKILSKTSRGSLECKLEFDQPVREFEDLDSYSDYSE